MSWRSLNNPDANLGSRTIGQLVSPRYFNLDRSPVSEMHQQTRVQVQADPTDGNNVAVQVRVQLFSRLPAAW